MSQDIITVQDGEKDEQLKKNEWKNKSARNITDEVKSNTKSKKVQADIDMILLRVSETCEQLALYVEDIPRGMGYKNVEIKEVFENLAESIRCIPDAPRTAAKLACYAKTDARKIPDLYEATRKIGFEEGYLNALQSKPVKLTNDLDLDFD